MEYTMNVLCEAWFWVKRYYCIELFMRWLIIVTFCSVVKVFQTKMGMIEGMFIAKYIYYSGPISGSIDIWWMVLFLHCPSRRIKETLKLKCPFFTHFNPGPLCTTEWSWCLLEFRGLEKLLSWLSWGRRARVLQAETRSAINLCQYLGHIMHNVDNMTYSWIMIVNIIFN